jgi:hypothetical protein
LSDDHKLGILKHEFYHLIFEHVTSRKPADGLKRIDNIAMDLAINCHIANELPSEANPGPTIGKEPMKACIPGEGISRICHRSSLMSGILKPLRRCRMNSKIRRRWQGPARRPGDPFGAWIRLTIMKVSVRLTAH